MLTVLYPIGPAAKQALRQRPGGFTLVELMIALAVIMVIVRLTVPALQSFAIRARIAGTANELQADVALARLEAVRRQARITLCSTPNPNPGATSVDCSAATADWAPGRWIFCSDPSPATPTGACCPDGPSSCGTFPATSLLKVRPAAGGTTTTVTGPAGAVVFHPNGAVTTPTGAPASFVVCASGQAGRTLTLGMAGQLLASDAPSACP